MTKFCQLVVWVCSFLVAVAIAQVVSSFGNWGTPVTLTIAGITYLYATTLGNKDGLHFQVVSVGLVLGWAKCYFGG